MTSAIQDCEPVDDPAQRLCALIAAEGVAHGREDSFKLSQAGLSAQRFMLGVHRHRIAPSRVEALCRALGMPRAALQALLQHLGDANLLLFGIEQDGTETVCKVYLEFWDAVCRQVRRTGGAQPLLLDLGFKWQAGRDAQDARVARYTCLPLLSLEAIVDRVRHLCVDAGAEGVRHTATRIIEQAAAAAPGAAFVYLEAHEAGNPRRSFDIKLYQAGLCVRDIRPALLALAGRLGIDPVRLERHFESAGDSPLGHLSGGIDRHGRPFATIYHERWPLPAR